MLNGGHLIAYRDIVADLALKTGLIHSNAYPQLVSGVPGWDLSEALGAAGGPLRLPVTLRLPHAELEIRYAEAEKPLVGLFYVRVDPAYDKPGESMGGPFSSFLNGVTELLQLEYQCRLRDELDRIAEFVTDRFPSPEEREEDGIRFG